MTDGNTPNPLYPSLTYSSGFATGAFGGGFNNTTSLVVQSKELCPEAYVPFPREDSDIEVDAFIRPKRARSVESRKEYRQITGSPVGSHYFSEGENQTRELIIRQRDTIREQLLRTDDQSVELQNRITKIEAKKSLKKKKEIEELKTKQAEADGAVKLLSLKLQETEQQLINLHQQGALLVVSAEKHVSDIRSETEIEKGKLKDSLSKKFTEAVDREKNKAAEETEKERSKAQALEQQLAATQSSLNFHAQQKQGEVHRLLQQQQQYAAAYTEAEKDRQTLRQRVAQTETANVNKDREINALRTEGQSIVENLQRETEQKARLEEQIQYLQESLKQTSVQLSERAVNEEGACQQQLAAANYRIGALSIDLQAWNERYNTDLKRAQENINILNSELKKAQDTNARQQSNLPPRVEATPSAPSAPQFSRIDPGMASNKDVTKFLIDHLAILQGKEEKCAIPRYAGSASDQPIGTWLKEAEAVAIVNGWSDEIKQKNISSRLAKTALSWHVENMRLFPHQSFRDWKRAIKEQFSTPDAIDNLRLKFQSLRQKENEPTKLYIDRVLSAYRAIYGDPTRTIGLGEEAKALRSDVLLGSFMRGLRAEIRDAMWGGRLPPDYSWEQATRAAIEVEKMNLARKLFDSSKPINSLDMNVAAVMSALQNQVEELKIELKGSKESRGHAVESPAVNVIDRQERGRPRVEPRYERREFTNRNVNENRGENRATGHRGVNNEQNRGGREEGPRVQRAAPQGYNGGQPNQNRNYGGQQWGAQNNSTFQTRQGQGNTWQAPPSGPRAARPSNQGYYSRPQAAGVATQATRQQGNYSNPQAYRQQGGYEYPAGQGGANRPAVRCHICGKVGHVQAQCWGRDGQRGRAPQ